MSDQTAAAPAIPQVSSDAPQAENYDLLIERASSYISPEGLEKIERSYWFAVDMHKEQFRRSGEPYINHPVEVAIILCELKMDADAICAALLHDTVEDTDTSLATVSELFGEQVSLLVDGVTKLTNIEVDSLSSKQALNLRKMFLAMSKDIRVIIIKLADRLHNMRTLISLPEDRRIFKAKETMEIYAKLANRLGMSSIKWELEDLAFFYLEPSKYRKMTRMVTDSRDKREAYLNNTIDVLREELVQMGIEDFSISGRPKHLYSIYRKMINKGKDFSEIYDLIALRVITKTVKDCYSVLGSVHSLWHPMPGRFKDYIAMPKYNMYQSLHTTVIGPAGHPLEIQIRTEEMHQQAEYGIAAHWLYKEAGNSSTAKTGSAQELDDQLGWLKHILSWQDDMSDSQEYIESLKIDLFDAEVFVFTPKGEVMSLRSGSTLIDFAYAIHTEVGHHCVGAKVNGSVAPLSYELQMGDRVEILTQKNSNPSRDWINIVKTPGARSKIRSYFSKVNRSDDVATGRDALARELRKSGFGISNSRTTRALITVAEGYGYRDLDDLFATIGTNKLSPKMVAHRVVPLLDKDKDPALEAEKRALLSLETPMKAPRSNRLSQGGKKGHTSTGVVVKGGDSSMLVRLAHCCNPVVGDEIVGFVTRGRGVSVHRANCPNAIDLQKQEGRMIEVEWDSAQAQLFQVEIVIEAIDRMRLLQDVTVTIGDSGANILSASTYTNRDGIAQLRFLVELGKITQLDVLLNQVRGVDGVIDSRRLQPGEGAVSLKKL